MKLGKAFSDSLIIESKTRTKLNKNSGNLWWVGVGRPLLFSVLFFVAFFVLIWKLFDLTIVDGHTFRALADGNRTRELTRHAPRGILLDRTGKPLTQNKPLYRLIAPCPARQSQNSPMQDSSVSEDSCIKRLSKEEGEKMEKRGLPPGFFLEVDYSREYLYPTSTAHILGYTGEISAQELATEYFSLRNYASGDRVGRVGAEAVFEEQLRGRDGRELVEVDASGKILRTLGRDTESAGEAIVLSVDASLSDVVAKSFPEGFKGAVVVSKPTTGEILAMYSSPAYSLNSFSFGISEDDYMKLLEDPQEPLFNRAIGGAYPPGSTFKIVTALASLEEKAISSSTIVEDIGEISIGPFKFPNWFFIQYGKTEGSVDIVKAIQRSNDIFFYKAGEWLGIAKLSGWAKRLGIGKPLGIELSGEAGGLMPDPEWKNQRFSSEEDLKGRSNEWYLGDTYHVAIGQGYLLTTPLQVNTWTNIIANEGKLCKPTIQAQSSGLNAQGSELRAQGCTDLGIKKETVDLIIQGMKKACEPGGTGWPLFNFTINKFDKLVQLDQSAEETTPSARRLRVPVACKTGTAEFGDSNNKTHAWFTVFAPVPEHFGNTFKGETLQGADGNTIITGEPEISVTVLVEGAGEGSNVAAPIAKKILEAWFSR